MTCPYAKPIGYDHIRGYNVKPNRMIFVDGITTQFTPCTEACYLGDYTQCPFYREPEEV